MHSFFFMLTNKKDLFAINTPTRILKPDSILKVLINPTGKTNISNNNHHSKL